MSAPDTPLGSAGRSTRSGPAGQQGCRTPPAASRRQAHRPATAVSGRSAHSCRRPTASCRQARHAGAARPAGAAPAPAHLAPGCGGAALHEDRAVGHVHVKQVDLAIGRHRAPSAVQYDMRVVPAHARGVRGRVCARKLACGARQHSQAGCLLRCVLCVPCVCCHTHKCSASGPASWKPPSDSHRPVSLQRQRRQVDTRAGAAMQQTGGA